MTLYRALRLAAPPGQHTGQGSRVTASAMTLLDAGPDPPPDQLPLDMAAHARPLLIISRPAAKRKSAGWDERHPLKVLNG
jgi:hypothetical protein